MAYTTLRNMGAYIDHVAETFSWADADPSDVLEDLASMIESGAVQNINRFLKVYEAKANANDGKGTKEGGYQYTKESARKFSKMAQGLEEAAAGYRELAAYHRNPSSYMPEGGQQTTLPGVW